jgi:hypothetical protein
LSFSASGPHETLGLGILIADCEIGALGPERLSEHYSHFFQRKSIYGPIAAQAISMIARG